MATLIFRKTVLGLLLLHLLLMLPEARLWAESTDPMAKMGSELSLEDLVNLKVTSVSKKETRLEDSPAAVSVIRADEIDRLGITTLPEALRLVPGMDVARINGNQWAISSRGFNGEFANKLLVLIDGRAVYTPASAGVFWNAQDVVLEDLDRIEVIRGPGATLWGVNAVDGVVNIITKSAKETQGGLLSTVVGIEDQPTTTARYGGQLGSNTFYRVYGKFFNRDSLVDSQGHDASDEWHALRGGFRLDWEPSEANVFTLQGDYYNAEADKRVNELSLDPPAVRQAEHTDLNAGGNLLGRWTHDFSDSSAFTAQTYYDHVQQGDGFGREYRDTIDFDFDHRFDLGRWSEIVWGGGYRYANVRSTPSPALIWTPEDTRLDLFNAFVQDTLGIVPDRLFVTLGSKFEHNNLTGLEIEPSARLLWKPTEEQSVWGAVSRATRTPSLFERDARLNEAAFATSPSGPPALVSLLGNSQADAEKVLSYELGYRIRPLQDLSLEVAGFYNNYWDLLGAEPNPAGFEASPGPPHVLISSSWENRLSGQTYGVELSGQWKVTDHWRWVGSYSWLHMRIRPDPSLALDSPQQQFQLRSYLDVLPHVQLSGAVYYVDEVEPEIGPNRLRVSAYLRCDLGLVWRPYESLELGLWGQNLAESRHVEYTSINSTLVTEVPRGVLGKITWRF